ncbi:MAG: response regulator transcription factor [Bacteroidota bacterium]
MHHFLIIEKQPVIVAGLTSFILTGFPSAEITSVAPEDLNADFLYLNYNCYVLGIGTVVSENDALISGIIQHQNNAKIIVFTNETNTLFARHYLKTGAKGYIAKNVTKEEFLTCLLTVLGNSIYLSNDIKEALAENYVENKTASKLDVLSKRELEVATMLAKGLSNNEICTILKLHSSSVGTFKTRIFEKLNVKNIIELRHFAQANNMILG